MRFYVLGLLNSKLLDWYLRRTSSTFRGGWFSYELRFISRLPIQHNPADALCHHRVANLADKMLELHRRLDAADSTAEKNIIDRQIKATDAAIDRLVYDLYGLTEEEIAIVEGVSP